MVVYHGVFHVIPGKRDEYISEIKNSGFVEKFREQKGNLFYEASASIENENDVIVCDAWEDEDAFEGHVKSDAVAKWHEIYHRYVPDCDEKEYHS